MAPSGGGGVLGHKTRINTDNSATQTLSAEEEKIAAEMQADLLAGTLNLDPENDPVLGTTESGIEIKFHGKALTGNWDYNSFMTNYLGSTTSAYKSGNFYNLSGYLYITLGGYNWIIIGRNSNLNTISFTNTYAQSNETPSNFIKFASYNTYANALKGQTETTTDAGSAINSANAKGIVNTVSGISRSHSVTLSSFNVISTADLDNYPGCVLCLSSEAGVNKTYGHSFMDSAVKTEMTTIYENIKSAAGNSIQSTSLTTFGYNNAIGKKYTHSEYLFPLAYKGANSSQNFCVETYFDPITKRDCDRSWWLRSGSSYNACSYYVKDTTCDIALAETIYVTNGVRPAFVLKIT